MQWFKVMTATEISKKSVEATKCVIPEQKTKGTKMLFVFTQLQSWPVGQINWSMEEAAPPWTTNTKRIQARKQSKDLLWQPF